MQRVNQTQLQTVFVEGLVSASGGHMVQVRKVKLELLFEMQQVVFASCCLAVSGLGQRGEESQSIHPRKVRSIAGDNMFSLPGFYQRQVNDSSENELLML